MEDTCSLTQSLGSEWHWLTKRSFFCSLLFSEGGVSEWPWVCAGFAGLDDISAATDTSFRIKELHVQKESHTSTASHTRFIQRPLWMLLPLISRLCGD